MSTAKLEGGTSEPFQIAMLRISQEHEEVLTQPAKEDGQKVGQPKPVQVQKNLEEGNNSEDEAQTDNESMEVEVEKEIHIEWPDEAVTYEGMQVFHERLTHDHGITQGPDWQRIVEGSKNGGSDNSCTSNTMDVASKCKRVSSIASALSKVSIL